MSSLLTSIAALVPSVSGATPPPAAGVQGLFDALLAATGDGVAVGGALKSVPASTPAAPAGADLGVTPVSGSPAAVDDSLFTAPQIAAASGVSPGQVAPSRGPLDQRAGADPLFPRGAGGAPGTEHPARANSGAAKPTSAPGASAKAIEAAPGDVIDLLAAAPSGAADASATGKPSGGKPSGSRAEAEDAPALTPEAAPDPTSILNVATLTPGALPAAPSPSGVLEAPGTTAQSPGRETSAGPTSAPPVTLKRGGSADVAPTPPSTMPTASPRNGSGAPFRTGGADATALPTGLDTAFAPPGVRAGRDAVDPGAAATPSPIPGGARPSPLSPSSLSPSPLSPSPLSPSSLSPSPLSPSPLSPSSLSPSPLSPSSLGPSSLGPSSALETPTTATASFAKAAAPRDSGEVVPMLASGQTDRALAATPSTAPGVQGGATPAATQAAAVAQASDSTAQAARRSTQQDRGRGAVSASVRTMTNVGTVAAPGTAPTASGVTPAAPLFASVAAVPTSVSAASPSEPAALALAASDQADAGAELPNTDAALTAPVAPAAARELATAATPTAPEPRAVPATVQALAAEMAQKLGQRISRFEMALNPAGLGQVNVSLQIGARGQVSAALSFDRPGSAAELKGRAHELEGALRDAGFDVAPGALSFTLDAGLAGDGGGRRAPQSFGEQGDGSPRANPAARAFGAAAERADPPPYRSSRASRGLDIHV